MVVVRGSACRAAVWTLRRGTPASRAAIMHAGLAVPWAFTFRLNPAPVTDAQSVATLPVRGSSCRHGVAGACPCEHGHRRVVTADAADPAAAAGTGATHEQVGGVGFDAPRSRLRVRTVGLAGAVHGVRVAAAAGPGPAQVRVEDVASRQAEARLEVEGAHRLDAGPAVRVAGEAVADRLGEVRVEARQVASDGLVTDRLLSAAGRCFGPGGVGPE